MLVFFHLIIFVIFFLSFILSSINGYETGDRVITNYRAHHGNVRSELQDIAWNIMPHFGVNEVAVFTSLVPQEKNSSSPFRIDTKNDFKIMFNFDHGNFVIPWFSSYDAENRKSLKKLKLIFSRNEYEILKVDYSLIYGPKLGKIDPTHPTLRGFSIEYEWIVEAEENLSFGLQFMFLSCLVGFFVLFTVVIMSGELENSDNESSKQHTQSSQAPRSSKSK